MIRGATVDGQIQHLIEITIIKPPIPADGKHMAAHDMFHGMDVECTLESIHVIGQIAAGFQIVKIPSHRAIDQTEQRIENNAV